MNDATAIILGTNVNTALFALVTYYFFAFFKNFLSQYSTHHIFSNTLTLYMQNSRVRYPTIQ